MRSQMTAKLTATQQHLVNLLKQQPEPFLVRLPGGIWTIREFENLKPGFFPPRDKWFTIQTLKALEKKGVLKNESAETGNFWRGPYRLITQTL